ncbi:MAG: response regulator [Bacteroidetes bacterium]|jgi:signal transduction histidine kinase|nr:response regulator [Bacteroidota bacterium]
MQKPLKIKILLVDDKENNLLSMESIFERDGYQLTRANSGKEALKILLKEHDFTLILMDVEMPDINGFEAASMIYQRDKLMHIPIIFITAHSYGDENIFKGYKAGAVDYIYKPIQSELLRAKVSVFVELYKKNHQLMATEQKLKAINKSLEIEVKDRIASEEKVIELNKKLLKNIEQLESTNKELDQFAFIASHDLQEPLRKIRTFSNRVVTKYRESLDDEGKMYMDKMQNACERMQNLINDILAFSKIAVSKESLVHSDLNAILEELITDMDLQIHEKNAKISVDKLPMIHVYPTLMKPLFQNLLNNSLKYSRKDIAPVIEISGKIESHEDKVKNKITKFCRITVKDNGVGFEQQYAEQIFTMFKRLHGNSEYAGTGIGLAICKKIVEEHHGYISAKGTVNEGAVFTITLPLEIEESITDKIPQQVTGTSPQG